MSSSTSFHITPFPPIEPYPFITTIQEQAPKLASKLNTKVIDDLTQLFSKSLAKVSVEILYRLQEHSPFLFNGYLTHSHDLKIGQQIVRMTPLQYFLVHYESKQAGVLVFLSKRCEEAVRFALTSKTAGRNEMFYFMVASTCNDGAIFRDLESRTLEIFIQSVFLSETSIISSLKVNTGTNRSSRFLEAFKKGLSPDSDIESRTPDTFSTNVLTSSPFVTTVAELDPELASQLDDKLIWQLDDLFSKPLADWPPDTLAYLQFHYPSLLASFLHLSRTTGQETLTALQYFLIHFEEKQAPILQFLVRNCQEVLEQAITCKCEQNPIFGKMVRSARNDGTIFKYIPQMWVTLLVQNVISAETRQTIIRSVTHKYKEGLNGNASTKFIDAFHALSISQSSKRKRSAVIDLEVIDLTEEEKVTVDIEGKNIDKNDWTCITRDLWQRVKKVLPELHTKYVFGVFQYIFEKNLTQVFCQKEKNKISNFFCSLLLNLLTDKEQGKVFEYLIKYTEEQLYDFLSERKSSKRMSILHTVLTRILRSPTNPPHQNTYTFIALLWQKYPNLYLDLWIDTVDIVFSKKNLLYDRCLYLFQELAISAAQMTNRTYEKKKGIIPIEKVPERHKELDILETFLKADKNNKFQNILLLEPCEATPVLWEVPEPKVILALSQEVQKIVQELFFYGRESSVIDLFEPVFDHELTKLSKMTKWKKFSFFGLLIMTLKTKEECEQILEKIIENYSDDKLFELLARKNAKNPKTSFLGFILFRLLGPKETLPNEIEYHFIGLLSQYNPTLLRRLWEDYNKEPKVEDKNYIPPHAFEFHWCRYGLEQLAKSACEEPKFIETQPENIASKILLSYLG